MLVLKVGSIHTCQRWVSHNSSLHCSNKELPIFFTLNNMAEARWVHLVLGMADLHICRSIPKADIISKSSRNNNNNINNHNSKLLQVMKVQQMFQNRQLSQLPHLRLLKDHKAMLHEDQCLWHHMPHIHRILTRCIRSNMHTGVHSKVHMATPTVVAQVHMPTGLI